ncbi:MAG: hypothetical protein ACI9Y7_001089 [Dokdonia sp.]|jgi:hypothetical protein
MQDLLIQSSNNAPFISGYYYVFSEYCFNPDYALENLLRSETTAK